MNRIEIKSMNVQYESGYLEIILGPMFSGKTSRLIEIYKQCKFCNINVVAINHSCDERYDKSLLTSHDNVKIVCIKTDNLLDLLLNEKHILEKTKIKLSEIILINEGQFFEDLEEFVKELLKLKKKIYVCGLDGDFERKKFGKILDIIPLSDNVIKLSSLCSLCKNGTSGIFSKRITNETDQVVVGSENYIPVCRKCYEL